MEKTIRKQKKNFKLCLGKYVGVITSPWNCPDTNRSDTCLFFEDVYCQRYLSLLLKKVFYQELIQLLILIFYELEAASKSSNAKEVTHSNACVI